MWCADNVNGVVWMTGATRNKSRNFPNVLDGVNIIVAQLQDIGESKSQYTWRGGEFMFLVEMNKRNYVRFL